MSDATKSEDTAAPTEVAAGQIVHMTEDGSAMVADPATGEAVKGSDGNPIAVDTDAGVAVVEHPEGEGSVVADPKTGEPIKDSGGDVIEVTGPDSLPTTTTEGGTTVLADPTTSEPIVSSSGDPIVIGTQPIETVGAGDSAPLESAPEAPASGEQASGGDAQSGSQASEGEGASTGSTDVAGNELPPTPPNVSQVQPDPVAVQPNSPEAQPADGTAASDKPVMVDGAGGASTTDSPATLGDIKPGNDGVTAAIPASALDNIKEGGNLLYKGLAQYGAEELKAVESSAVFINLHNKLAHALAALEALFGRA